MKDRILPILALVIAAALWNSWCDNPRVRRDMVLADSVRVTESSRRATDSLRVEMAHRESVAVGTIRRQGQQITGARSEIARLRSLTTPPPVMRDTAETLRQFSLRDSLIAQQDTIIARLDTVVTLQQAMLASRDTMIGRLERERESYRGLAEDFRRRAEPGLLERVRRGLPYVALGAVLWELAR